MKKKKKKKKRGKTTLTYKTGVETRKWATEKENPIAAGKYSGNVNDLTTNGL